MKSQGKLKNTEVYRETFSTNAEILSNEILTINRFYQQKGSVCNRQSKVVTCTCLLKCISDKYVLY